MEVLLHAFLTLTLGGTKLSASRIGRIIPAKSRCKGKVHQDTAEWTSALNRSEWSASRLEEIASCTHWPGDWVGLGTGLGFVEKRKSCPYGESNAGRQAYRRPLYHWAIKYSCTHWIGGCMGPKASLDAAAKRNVSASAENRCQIFMSCASSLFVSRNKL
jgi:hypothetical protein